jgi:hypothetical protein
VKGGEYRENSLVATKIYNTSPTAVKIYGFPSLYPFRIFDPSLSLPLHDYISTPKNVLRGEAGA